MKNYTITDAGIINVAAAMLSAMGRDYLNAKALNALAPCRRSQEMMDAYAAEILATPWNLTALDNDELLHKIDRDGIMAIGEKEVRYA